LPPAAPLWAFAAALFPLYRPVKAFALTKDGASRVRNGARPHATVELSTNYKTSMTYIEQFETELRKKYDEAQDEEVLFRWICEKVLESYRNGITAGQKGVQVIRKGKSRSRSLPSQAQ
jgi:hypothetical protein